MSVTINLKLWQNPNFPPLDILESRTKAVLEAFNRCKKLDIILQTNDNKIKNFNLLFNSLTEKRAVESLRLSMYSEDVVVYVKLLSEGNSSILAILGTLSSLLDAAQDRQEITKKLKQDYQEFLENFNNEVVNGDSNESNEQVAISAVPIEPIISILIGCVVYIYFQNGDDSDYGKNMSPENKNNEDGNENNENKGVIPQGIEPASNNNENGNENTENKEGVPSLEGIEPASNNDKNIPKTPNTKEEPSASNNNNQKEADSSPSPPVDSQSFWGSFWGSFGSSTEKDDQDGNNALNSSSSTTSVMETPASNNDKDISSVPKEKSSASNNNNNQKENIKADSSAPPPASNNNNNQKENIKADPSPSPPVDANNSTSESQPWSFWGWLGYGTEKVDQGVNNTSNNYEDKTDSSDDIQKKNTSAGEELSTSKEVKEVKEVRLIQTSTIPTITGPTVSSHPSLTPPDHSNTDISSQYSFASFIGICSGLLMLIVLRATKPTLFRWWMKYFTNNDHKRKPRKGLDATSQQQSIERENKILEIKEKLPVIIQSVLILDQFWDNQITNLKAHIETLRSVNENEEIKIPQQIAEPIKDDWSKQINECKNNHIRMKDLVTRNSVLSID